MADISKLTLPSGTTYNLKDAQARSDIESLRNTIAGGVHFAGNTTTALTDGATTNPIKINNKDYVPAAGDIVIHDDSEFLWDGTKWVFFGDFGSLGALAFKDTASGTYKPAGTISQPTFTGTSKTVSVKGTPAGNITIGLGEGTSNYTPTGNVTQPTFTGTEGTVSVSGTPTGNIEISTGEGTANYTPKGTVTVTPTVTMNTTTVNSITNVGTLPTCTLPVWSGTVANENLTIAWTAGSFSQGTLPTKGANQTVATGVKSATATGTFNGEGAELTASFTGEALTSTGKFKPAGTVTKPTFNGIGVNLEATFTGTELTSTGSFKPEGSVSTPTFNGTQATITVSE